jgi:two-component system nitrogen regulation response regulator NtrX
MPGIDGIETLKEIKKESPHIQVIMITGHGTIETAIKASKLGAFDFIEKPLSIDEVIVTINNALNFRRLEEENRYLRKKTIEKHSISGNSPPVLALKKQISVAAPTDAWILITGENGTGKELVARTIHQLSSRSGKPMIDVNCAAIPEELIESELFGHEKGAFADATSKKIGKLELADKGTIFFDEIGDMSLNTQAKILRVLQEMQFQRIGGSRILHVNVRVIASSNKNLEKEIEKGNFREDLYYRLNVIPIEVPPLRNRPEDIYHLIKSFLDTCAQQNRCKKKQISNDAIDKLISYPWPGNVRELKNLVERLVIMVDKNVIEVSDIPAVYYDNQATKGTDSLYNQLFSSKFKDAQKIFETEYLSRHLLLNNNDISKTAAAIGVERSFLQKKIKTS